MRNVKKWVLVLGALAVASVTLGVVVHSTAAERAGAARADSSQGSILQENMAQGDFVLAGVSQENFADAVRKAGDYTSEMVLRCYAGDYEKDGASEAFVLASDPQDEWNSAIWFVSDKGEAELLEEKVLFPEDTAPVAYHVADRDFLLVTYVFGNPWFTNVYGVEDGRPVNQIPYGEEKTVQGDTIICQASAYDCSYQAEDDMLTGHSIKPYYFHYVTDASGKGEFQEYLAKELTADEVAKLAGGQAILDNLRAKYGDSLESLQYLLRENGLLHINIGTRKGDSIDYIYETWELTNGSYALAEQAEGIYLRGLTADAE
ncbi:MAG: hypothetical protein NC092_04355 [Butyrivibrio sp.]|nr:hypothetical protein [Muribaculum sp.]MCM1551908.1 hypothetical protein [Butyrivibrio sp.]